MTVGAFLRDVQRVELLQEPGGNARAFERIQRNANQSVARLNDSPVGGGRFIDVDFTGSTTQRVMHTLPLRIGATPGGYLPVAQDAAATFHYTAWDDKTITFVASAACHARFWVFA